MSSDNQKAHWNRLHKQRTLEKYSKDPTDFAKEVVKLFSPNAKILELGCGLGNDSNFFSKNGYSVLATDFSQIVIEENTRKYSSKNLEFIVKDTQSLSDFDSSSFGVVYARLSLHYFPDLKTRKIFNEIYRILKSRGLFCFICKSTRDPLFGKGDEIEKDMFEFENHVRHFFSIEYTNSLLKDLFTIEKVEEDYENLYGKKSAFIKVIARKN